MFNKGILKAATVLFLAIATTAFADWNSTPIVAPHQFGFWKAHRSIGWDPVNSEFVLAYGGDQLYVSRGRDDSWTTEIVDDQLGRGSATSLFIENDGTIHLAYYDREQGDLWYAIESGSVWSTEKVRNTEDSGAENSIVVDSSGTVYIAYLETNSSDIDHIRLVKKSGGSWTDCSIDLTDKCGQSPSIALDASENPTVAYFCYYDTHSHEAKYLVFNGVTFIVESVDSGDGVGYDTSLAFDDSGVPHIVYYKSGSAQYATRSKGWSAEPVETESFATGFSNELFFSNGAPYVLTEDWHYDRVLLFTYSTSWSFQEVAQCDSLIQEITGVQDDQGDLNVAFVDFNFDTASLKIAYDVGSKAWTTHELDSYLAAGEGRDLAINQDGMPYVSYISPDVKINVVGWDGSSWLIDEAGSWMYWYYHTGIAIMPDQFPVVAYHNSSAELGISQYNGSSWVTDEVDVPTSVGQTTKIATDSAGNLHVAYIDENYELIYAKNSTGAWTTKIINPGGNTWMQIDIALDGNDALHVCWGDYSTDDLGYATNESGVMSTQTFSGEGGMHGPCGIALDSNDNPHILYGKPSDDTLRLKYEDGTKTWQDKLLTTNIYTFAGIGFAIDDADGMHLSYFSLGDYTLKYGNAPNHGSLFIMETVDEIHPNNYFESTLALDPDGNPLIAYQHTLYGRLNLAFNMPDAELISITPNNGEVGQTVSVTISGTDLFAVEEIAFYNGYEAMGCNNMNNSDRQTVDCDVDLTGVTPGIYDVLMWSANGNDNLEDAFTVDEAQTDDDDSADDDDATDDDSTDDDSSDDDSGESGDDDEDESCCGGC